MLLFLVGIAILVAGYFTYGKLVEKILGPDEVVQKMRKFLQDAADMYEEIE